MTVGHRGKRAENAGSSGALSSRTMRVTITAKTASEYVASRCAVSLSSRIRFLGDLRREMLAAPPGLAAKSGRASQRDNDRNPQQEWRFDVLQLKWHVGSPRGRDPGAARAHVSGAAFCHIRR